MDSDANARYGPHSEATAPQVQPGLDRRVPEVVAIPDAIRAQRRRVNDVAASQSAEQVRDQVAAHYSGKVCQLCHYPAWNLVAGVCGACRRGR